LKTEWHPERGEVVNGSKGLWKTAQAVLAVPLSRLTTDQPLGSSPCPRPNPLDLFAATGITLDTDTVLPVPKRVSTAGKPTPAQLAAAACWAAAAYGPRRALGSAAESGSRAI